jgi:hypothetical protein
MGVTRIMGSVVYQMGVREAYTKQQKRSQKNPT